MRHLHAFALAVVLAAAATTPASASGDAAKGKDFVQQNCARCHAIGLHDDSHLPEAVPFRELHNRYPIDDLEEAFAEGIVTGHPKMPQFELDTQTIDDILAYLKSLAGPGG